MTKLCGSSGEPSSRGLTPAMRVAAARKRGGQGERPIRNFVRIWTGASVKKRPAKPAIRSQRIREESADSLVPVNGDAVQFHAMVDQAEAEPLGNAFLK